MDRNNGSGGVALYEAPDGKIRLDVRLEQDSVWLSLNQLVASFERDKSMISRHLRNVFAEGEVDRTATVAKKQRFKKRAVARSSVTSNTSTWMRLSPSATA